MNPLPFLQADAGVTLGPMEAFRWMPLRAHCFSQSTPIGLDCLGWRRHISDSCKYSPVQSSFFQYYTLLFRVTCCCQMMDWLLENLNLWHFGYKVISLTLYDFCIMVCLCGMRWEVRLFTDFCVWGSILSRCQMSLSKTLNLNQHLA